MAEDPNEGGISALVSRSLAAGGALAALAIVLLAAWRAIPALLLIFAGVLLGILLHAAAHAVRRRTGLTHGISLASVVLSLALASWGVGAVLVPRVVSQIDALQRSLPEAIDQFEARLRQTAWGRELLQNQDSLSQRAGKLAGEAVSAFSVALGVFGNIVAVLFLGLFFAAEPGSYSEALTRLVPPGGRARANTLLRELASTLQWWLIGMLLSMTVVGVLTATGLWLLGSPLAVSLGLLAALLAFVPNIGPVVAAVPAVLLAFRDGPLQALWVALLYVGIQAVESYLVTPLIQRRTVQMPPALVLSAQFVLGTLTGLLGLVFATPLVAAGIVLIRRLYVEPLEGETAPRRP